MSNMIRLQNWFYKYNAWSFTKHRLWKECKLAYYYQYIGRALQNPTSFNVYELKRLKDLDSRFVLQGKLIHEIIEEQIEQHHQKRKMNEGVAKVQYVERVEQYRNNAQNSLVEYFNGEPVNHTFFDRIRENGLDQISMFFGVVWLQLENLDYLRHEKFDRFKAGNAEAIVKIDYVSKVKDGEIVISDWKTGIDDEKYENDLQIAGYVLWATNYYRVKPESVRSELVYLTTGQTRSYRFSEKELKEVEQLIISDFEEMNNSYDIQHFEPNPSPRQCLGCNYASMCVYSQANEHLRR
jgi:CRISPR/Cas system-associated exonuclease Cas4 (RecB family)